MKTATKKSATSRRNANRTAKSNRSTGGNARAKSNSQAKENTTERKKEDKPHLNTLLEDGLKDIYWAEKALTKALPEMIKNASSDELVQALENHLQETEGHVSRLEQVFESLGQEAQAKKCYAMEGLIEEADSMMDDAEEGDMMDAAIIAAAQKVEHYEIATYGTLRTFAETLGLKEAQGLLEQTLEEEKKADEKLTEIAMSAINEEAASNSDENESEKGEEHGEQRETTSSESGQGREEGSVTTE